MSAPEVGGLRTRLVLQGPVDTPDDTGAFSRSWTAVATLWANVVPVVARQQFPADAIEVAISHHVTIRGRADVVNGMRFLLGDRALLIRAVTDPEMRGRYLLCRCEEFAP